MAARSPHGALSAPGGGTARGQPTDFPAPGGKWLLGTCSEGPMAARETANCLFTSSLTPLLTATPAPQEPGTHWHPVPPPPFPFRTPDCRSHATVLVPAKVTPLQPEQEGLPAECGPVGCLDSQAHRPALHHAWVSPPGGQATRTQRWPS